ncbi:hypothetical protein ANN_04004 [Periplaneta americana]|uniref:Uncharacterized protein n=1 Tax=Periplaneta americana TaxID=6978 RepID=A0ABQ8T840_PERAM|nr:hypothetical protein ANN_04004 [Periplaneta americana]
MVVLKMLEVTHRLSTPRPIIVVRFAKRSSRDLWLNRFREEAKNNKEGFGLPTQKKKLSIIAAWFDHSFDHLTPFMKNLFNKTKLTARENVTNSLGLKTAKFVL